MNIGMTAQPMSFSAQHREISSPVNQPNRITVLVNKILMQLKNLCEWIKANKHDLIISIVSTGVGAFTIPAQVTTLVLYNWAIASIVSFNLISIIRDSRQG